MTRRHLLAASLALPAAMKAATVIPPAPKLNSGRVTLWVHMMDDMRKDSFQPQIQEFLILGEFLRIQTGNRHLPFNTMLQGNLCIATMKGVDALRKDCAEHGEIATIILQRNENAQEDWLCYNAPSHLFFSADIITTYDAANKIKFLKWRYDSLQTFTNNFNLYRAQHTKESEAR